MRNSIRSLFPVILVSCFFFWAKAADCLDPSRIDKRAQSVARLLQPVKLSKGTEKDLGRLKGQMIRLLEEMEKSHRTAHSPPESLLSKAFQFRDRDIGRYEAVVTTSTLLNNWKKANAMGLFDGKGKFTGRVSKGMGSGGNAVFEYIVPPSEAPEFSKFMGNVRLVRNDRKRSPGAELSMRDQAFVNSLEQIRRESVSRATMREIEVSKVEDQSEAKDTELYRKAVQAAGDAVKQVPEIRMVGKLLSRPGHINQNRYRVNVDVTNTSNHPTEIKVEYFMIGQSDKLNRLYIMQKGAEILKLRAGQVKDIEIWSKPVNQYVGKVFALDEKKSKKIAYRGFIARVSFSDKGIISTTASDARMMAYGSGDRPGLDQWPVF